jgi:hypothetical protein
MLPFFATFAIGLFIASFFVSIGPNFRSRGFGGRHQEMKRLRIENEMLKDENMRLKSRVEAENWDSTEMPRIAHDDFRGYGPEVPVEGPPPPRRAPRHGR